MLYLHRLSEFGHLQQKVHDSFLFTWGGILVALGLLFFRALAVCTGMEGRASDTVMIC